MFVVFVARLASPAGVEAAALAPLLGVTEYETRLALSAPPPTILLVTTSRQRANDAVAAVRARGHLAHVFDDEAFTGSDAMTSFVDFHLDADGVRRVPDGALLPYGDVFAILRAVHDSAREKHTARPPRPIQSPLERLFPTRDTRIVTSFREREHVAYFFRRSGARPWILRERSTSYAGLGSERQPAAFANFAATVARMREACPMAVTDDRLLRRRVAERTLGDPLSTSSQEGVDLLAHLLAFSIASHAGSPYR